MDYQRKKQLTQSVSYLQSHLVVGQEMIDAMRGKGLFTDEELITIQKDDLATGKVVELVCLLKRKDTRTFTKFIEVLEDLGYDEIATVLKSNNNYAESSLFDPRTLHFLENFLSGIAVPQRTIEDLASVMMPKEIYCDDTNELQNRIELLEKQLMDNTYTLKREGTQTSMSCNSHGSGEEIVSPTEPAKAAFFGKEPVPPWDVPLKEDDLELLLRQKDEIIKRKDEEYSKLRRILDDSQKDLQGVLDLNSQYLDIISRLNQMQGLGVAPKGIEDKSSEILELEGKLDESKARIEQLRRDLIVREDDLHLKQIELEKALKRERKIKEQLGLSDDADETAVQSTIRRLMEEGKMQRDDLIKISKELKRAMDKRHSLEDQVTSLVRDKEKIEFHMRQQDLAIKKFCRFRVATDALKKAEQTLNNGSDQIRAQLLKLPAIEQTGAGLGLSNRRAIHQQYCVFCRQEFQPLKGLTCRVHFRPIRRGKWSCCEDECHRSAGCLQLPHFYIEITADRKIFITDGARYMELT